MIPLVLGIFGALLYFGNSEVRRFENQAARDIKASIRGEHARVSVRTKLNGLIGGPLGDMKQVTIKASDFETDGIPLFVQPELSKKGIIRDLRIELKDFSLAGLRIQSLTSDIPDCRFDYTLAMTKRRIRLSKSGVGRGEVAIREKDLEAYILRKFGEIKRASVRIADGRVMVEGYGEFLVVKANFVVVARLASPDGTKLVLEDAHISFDGQPADEIASKALLDTLNPVVDLNRDLKLEDAIHVDAITMQGGVLRAAGSTKVPDQPSPLTQPYGQHDQKEDERQEDQDRESLVPSGRTATLRRGGYQGVQHMLLDGLSAPSDIVQDFQCLGFRDDVFIRKSAPPPYDHHGLLLFRENCLGENCRRLLNHA